ncbi:MFS transporter [Phycicoccus flavus]|uniref:MFS transporter n=1 Tax=Phycicoccus flavus TaxID=2502783 RepID=UPI000FEBE532|nr:MFS transporter [Phycicoccus flavus]NHA68605.1 MFS transporter [Phycicoccus flavus]NHA68696.1 MFS transporter [Phycicoccus flavus]
MKTNTGRQDHGIRGRYGPVVLTTLLALVPYLVATSALRLLGDGLAADLSVSSGFVDVTQSMATAMYAFGALLAGDLGRRFPQRPTYLVLIALALVGWLLALGLLGAWSFAVGFVLVGLTTGLLLIVSLPPAIQRFPAAKVPMTAVFVNVGLFGGVAGGPLAAGIVDRFGGWRVLFAVLALTTALAVVLGASVLERTPAMAPDLVADPPVVVLALVATVLAFGAVALLPSVGFVSPWFFAPLLVGLTAFAAIFIVEDRRREPLVAVGLLIRTAPVIGTLVASFAGGVFLSLVSLTQLRMVTLWGLDPGRVGLDLWPLVPGALLAAVTLGLVFRTRYLPVLILFGLVAMILAGLVLMSTGLPEDLGRSQLALGALGFGAGATVSPALFLAGLSTPSAALGRIFAFVELVRSIGDFLIGPVLVQFAALISADGAAQERQVAITLGIAVTIGVGTLFVCTVAFLASYRRLPVPDLSRWLDGDDPAIESPGAFRGAQDRDDSVVG